MRKNFNLLYKIYLNDVWPLGQIVSHLNIEHRYYYDNIVLNNIFNSGTYEQITKLESILIPILNFSTTSVTVLMLNQGITSCHSLNNA